jgi:1-acyl-sn-glycerol-3-phosphate acyltransferase
VTADGPPRTSGAGRRTSRGKRGRGRLRTRGVVYDWVIRVGRLVFRLLGLRVRLDGLEHVPRTGPAVLAATHVSFLDFLLLGLVGEEQGGRRVRFLARHDVWRVQPVGWLMRRMGHIPVDRDAPAHAYLLARDALRRGELVGIFPEAGVSRSWTVRALMPGAAALSRDTGAPLLPVVLWGGQRLWTAKTRPTLRRGAPVSITVGPRLPSLADPRETTVLLGCTLQQMLDGAQAEARHQPGDGEVAPWHPRHLGGAALSVADAAAVQDVPASAVAPTWSPAAAVRGAAEEG